MIATNAELADAAGMMRKIGTDISEIELKDGRGGFPKSILESMSALANTHGGTIIIGITEDGFHSVDKLDVKMHQAAPAQAARNDFSHH
ncbi:MAG: ATP-binding protein [Corynebacterium sp.]|nr:ATP-binding protein [Corynebacterium sp.]